MTYILKWRPADTGIPAALRFSEKDEALEQACALLARREQNVELYENGKLVPMSVIRLYRESRPKAASEKSVPQSAQPTPAERGRNKRR